MLIGAIAPTPPRSVSTRTRPGSGWSRPWIVAGVAIGTFVALSWWGSRKSRGARRNPLPRDPYRAYRSFHWGNNPDKTKRVRLSKRPRRLVQLGALDAITYATRKGTEDADYVHRFGKRGRGRPALAYDPDGRGLHIIGGKYTVEDRGIVG